MSLSSLILAFAPALAARFKSVELALEAAEARIAELTGALELEMRARNHLMDEVASLRRQRDIWREIANRPMSVAKQVAGEALPNPFAALAQAAQNAQAYNQGLANMGLLGAQGLYAIKPHRLLW